MKNFGLRKRPLFGMTFVFKNPWTQSWVMALLRGNKTFCPHWKAEAHWSLAHITRGHHRKNGSPLSTQFCLKNQLKTGGQTSFWKQHLFQRCQFWHQGFCPTNCWVLKAWCFRSSLLQSGLKGHWTCSQQLLMSNFIMKFSWRSNFCFAGLLFQFLSSHLSPP